MGSGDHRCGLPQILSLGYEVQEEESLVELEKNLGPSQVRRVKMAARSHPGSEMPLEELLALYGYDVSDPVLHQDREPNELAASLPDMTLDKDQITKDLFSGEEDEETQSSADDLTPSVTSHDGLFRRHLRAHSLAGGDKDTSVSSSDEDSDSTSIPSSDGRKDIMVGSQYQATIPPLSSYSHQERAYENEDQLLWTPGVLSAPAVEEFLFHAQRRGGQDGPTDTLTAGDTVKDNEQALYELVKCNFNAEEALRRLRFNVKVFNEELCAWSEEECRNFEHGYRVHGKNFHLIQANKVRTRSVGECVEYYYMWKKSDRHEYFTQQTTKLGRKKYSLQSGNMEDGEHDGDVGELEGSSNSHSSSHGSLATVQLDPPSPPPVMDLDKQDPDAEMEMGVLEMCGSPRPREQLLGQFSPLPAPEEEPREPVTNCPAPGSCPPLPPAQLYASQSPRGTAPPQPPDTRLLGSGFYQLQLGSFVRDSPPAGSERGTSARLQMDFSLPPAPPPAPPAITPSDFGAISSYLCPSALRPAPVQHPRSLTQ